MSMENFQNSICFLNKKQIWHNYNIIMHIKALDLEYYNVMPIMLVQQKRPSFPLPPASFQTMVNLKKGLWWRTNTFARQRTAHMGTRNGPCHLECINDNQNSELCLELGRQPNSCLNTSKAAGVSLSWSHLESLGAVFCRNKSLLEVKVFTAVVQSKKLQKHE